MNERIKDVHVLIGEHDNGSEVFGVYADAAVALQDAERYQQDSDDDGNIIEFFVETHSLI
jgi:hypothetical protein